MIKYPNRLKILLGDKLINRCKTPSNFQTKSQISKFIYNVHNWDLLTKRTLQKLKYNASPKAVILL